MRWAALVVAAGRGTRFGGPKQLIELAGAPMLLWSMRTLAQMPEVAELVVVTETEWIETVESLARMAAAGKPYAVVDGGETRQASVRNGLHALSPECEAVLVHDGARPLVRAADVRDAMAVVREGRAALLGVPVVDTIKVVDRSKRTVMRTLDREDLWAAQTPQLATVRDMRRAHLEATRSPLHATDDATLLERIGVDVEIVPGSPDNFKVTVFEDVGRAEYALRDRLQHAPGEEEVLIVEMFVDAALVDAACGEIAARGGTIDGIERDLPGGAAIRAYMTSRQYPGFVDRFESVAGGTSAVTARFSHYAARAAN
ncbi:MAG: 2-C-methyl-D-erythritol 4-phosphate cytidylyltransferase [Vulcanimicrobiaceae bacterium]